ncbi:MAG: ferredoxin [Actinomycetia bacterium]|nr:ferredoxin [Actinomycetes bacterium]MCP4960128.1 ferredoxin [Actinomycetes bacterium]
MKINVDYDVCESNAICTQVAPHLFEVRDDDLLYVLNDAPGDEDRERLMEAVNRCPRAAISVEG